MYTPCDKCISNFDDTLFLLYSSYCNCVFIVLKVIRSLKSSGKVPSDYEENFRRADHTFLYQLVFDPVSQKQVHLTTPPNDIDIKTIEEYTGLYPYYLIVYFYF